MNYVCNANTRDGNISLSSAPATCVPDSSVDGVSLELCRHFKHVVVERRAE